jgi:hypothetical protein
MITAADVRLGVDRLFQLLGYPIARVPIDPLEWKRGGITVPWNGDRRLELLARLDHFDLFYLEGPAAAVDVQRFLREYGRYNILTKSVLINGHDKTHVYGLTRAGALRRLTIDLQSPSLHAIDRLNLLALHDARDVGALFERALDREAITRQFFARFRGAVREVGAALHDETEEDRRQYALLLLSRLLFLCFVQQKGWLNGERRFLIDRATRAEDEGREFFTTVLEPLFFGCLNTPAPERDAVSRTLGSIPYLNGGLFEPSAFERRNPGVHLPNALMLRVLESVFERFDFSVDENDGAGTHVDPEMLGKVFESLMAGEERLATGSFYTPKEIVDVMTERAILEWTGGDAQRLENVTILDPACGSGAFLLSALGIIERMTGASRHEIVERSLYGVDVKAEAVRLCELRLWLAIVSAEDATLENVRPLPNLDRNILQGNSLLSPLDFLGCARGDIYREWAYGLRAQQSLVARYRSAPKAERPALSRLLRANDQHLAIDLLHRQIESDERELQRAIAPRHDLFGRPVEIEREACQELQNRIAESRRLLERLEEGEADFFSFDVHFAPVVSSGGFDIILGNPPWVRHARVEKGARRMYRERYKLFGNREPATGNRFHQPDLSLAFFERAVKLAAPDAVVSMLLPAKVANAAYAAPFRRFVEQELTLIDLYDWSDERLFAADTFPMSVIVRNAREQRGAARHTTDEWSLLPDDVARTLRRIREHFRPLAEVLGRRPVMGVKTGDNKSFFLDDEEARSIPAEFICRAVRGRDVRRWSTTASTWMLWPPARGWHELPTWLQQLAMRRGVEPERLRLRFVRPEHVGMKVAWKDVSRGMAAVVLPDTVTVSGHAFPLVPNQTLYCADAVSLDEAHAITAVLNSTVADALLLAVAERAKDAYYRYFGRTVAAMPFPRWTDEVMSQLVRGSRTAHRKGSAPRDLDLTVARLYGVNDDELAILRDWVGERLRTR